nr:hypothetical protein [Subtercola sp. Z020]
MLHDLLRVAEGDAADFKGGFGVGERSGEALARFEQPAGVALVQVQGHGELRDDLTFDQHLARPLRAAGERVCRVQCDAREPGRLDALGAPGLGCGDRAVALDHGRDGGGKTLLPRGERGEVGAGGRGRRGKWFGTETRADRSPMRGEHFSEHASS